MASKHYSPPLFNSGRIVITAGVFDLVLQGKLDPLPLLERHLTGSWGDISEEIAKANNEAVHTTERLLSSYRVNAEVTLYIVTAPDRSTTTLLLPREYDEG